MAVKVWVRNADLCIRECVEEGMTDLVWDRGRLIKMQIDPMRHAELYYGPGTNFRLLIVGTHDQGALAMRRGDSLASPTAVYPVWQYGDEMTDLESLMGTERLVVVTDLPSMNTAPARQVIKTLVELQEEFPKCMLHIHGLYSYKVMFGRGFKSVDIDPRTTARSGRVVLPVGRELSFEKACEMPHWITVVGMHTGDLSIPRMRCMFNMRSAKWAAKNFRSTVKYRTNNAIEIDPRAYTDPNFEPPQTFRTMVRNKLPVQDGDKFLCDVCSLQTSCRYVRSGSVCAVPDSEPAELAKFFKTRDSDTIIDGLGTLLATQTKRLERGLEGELSTGKIDKEVTRIINTLFDRGVKLAKLVDPTLAASDAARIKISFNAGKIQASTPQALMAAAVAQLEARGIERHNITSEMIQELLGDPEPIQQRAIEIAAREAEL